jgi:AraC-like DNA-binding protein
MYRDGVRKPLEIVRKLSESPLYRDYERAFRAATGLPLALCPPETWRQALDGKRLENPFCALMAKSSPSCAACLQVQQRISEGPVGASTTATCFAGLCDTAVPLRIGTETIGFLQTGQVALRRPTRGRFTKIARQLLEWGGQVDLRRAEDAYFHSKVLRRGQYAAVIRLLEIFAQHLSLLANQIMIAEGHAEPPSVARARAYIREHAGQDLPLGKVAGIVNMSTFHFCKMFHKATGLTFTGYLARTRVEKACNLLLNPHLRVGEIAYECGFGSLGHFNRIFKRMAGMTPTAYRRRLKKGM